MIRVFISSVQAEFAKERKALCKYIREDAMLHRFFELPALEYNLDCGNFISIIWRKSGPQSGPQDEPQSGRWEVKELKK